MSLKRWKRLNKTTKSIIKLFVFVSITSIPFISVTNILGMDVFLDSFEHPEYYLYIKDDNTLGSSGQYMMIQKSTHPEFNIENSDYVIYYARNGKITFDKIHEINAISEPKIYALNGQGNTYDNLVYENQIIGKIIKIVDGNIINSISIKIWEISIHNLNPVQLLENN